ncbi:MAG: hypothetical protein MK479_11400, partial [Planctomycetes bacterium]|nr:hypothetical protein [Planctomycetota bacterium]
TFGRVETPVAEQHIGKLLGGHGPEILAVHPVQFSDVEDCEGRFCCISERGTCLAWFVEPGTARHITREADFDLRFFFESGGETADELYWGTNVLYPEV